MGTICQTKKIQKKSPKKALERRERRGAARLLAVPFKLSLAERHSIHYLVRAVKVDSSKLLSHVASSALLLRLCSRHFFLGEEGHQESFAKGKKWTLRERIATATQSNLGRTKFLFAFFLMGFPCQGRSEWRVQKTGRKMPGCTRQLIWILAVTPSK